LEGSLPPGLPQDIVDDVFTSLVQHSALNATTLRVLQNCELGSLTLAGCRGVTDDWLEPFGASAVLASDRTIFSPHHSNEEDAMSEVMDFDDYEEARSGKLHQCQPQDLFCNATYDEAPSGSNTIVEESSCSTSSFVSASSTPYAVVTATSPSKEDDPMVDVPKSSSFVGNDDRHPQYHNQDCHRMSFADFDASSSSSCFLLQRQRSVGITSNMTLLDLRGSQRLTDKGLLQLSDLSSLEVARLDNCFSIQGRGLVAFSLSRRLLSLSLANCRRLTDEAIVNISHLTSLEALSLDGCRCLTDRSMVAISCLFRIKKLDLTQCDLISDEGLKELKHLEDIEELSLGWCRSISDIGIYNLCIHPGREDKLRVLSLARVPITDNGITHLSKLLALEELDLSGCSNIGSSSLGSTLCMLTKLTSLDVSYCPGIL
jgi:hypothetical protein